MFERVRNKSKMIFKSTETVFKIYWLGFEHKIWNCHSLDEREYSLMNMRQPQTKVL